MAKSKKLESQPQGLTIHEIPMRRPPVSARDPSKKTLIDLIDEHHPSLSSKSSKSKLEGSGRIVELGNDDGTVDSGSEEEEEEEIIYQYSRTAESVYMAVPLSILYTGLDVLCRQQYMQPVEVRETIFVALRGLPVIFLLNYMLHHRRKQALFGAAFFGASIAAGLWMVHATNRYGYYAVMKKAPGIGTLWIWCVVELDAILAFFSCMIVAIFFSLGDYRI